MTAGAIAERPVRERQLHKWVLYMRDDMHDDMHDDMRPSTLVKETGGRYARDLGIDLSRGTSAEIYKWFLASILFGTRISGTIAEKAYREFERANLLSPQKILDAGWDRLVVILDRGAYARYDFKTATKLLDVNRTLMKEYKGNLNTLHARAADEPDLEQRLKHLGKGIGDITVNIFLRELRGIWTLADPVPTERAIWAARKFGFISEGMHDKSQILEALKDAWRADGKRAKDFPEFEAALVKCGAHGAASRAPGKQHRTRSHAKNAQQSL